MAQAGYSKRSLPEKLGMRPGMHAAVIRAPQSYNAIAGKVLGASRRLRKGKMDFVHVFTTSRKELATELPRLKRALVPSGILWVSWPKQRSGADTDLNENIVREIGLRCGLVDVKVAAIDDVWSGLKFVYRLRDRRLTEIVSVVESVHHHNISNECEQRNAASEAVPKDIIDDELNPRASART